MQTIQLPSPLPSGITYDAVKVDRITVDPLNECWSCLVYGVAGGVTMPLNLQTLNNGVARIETLTIPYAQIAVECEAMGLPVGTINDALVISAGMKILQAVITAPAPVVET